MGLSREVMQELTSLLNPYMQDKQHRRGYLIRALGPGASVLNRLQWDTSTFFFIPNMVYELEDSDEIDGKPAVCALLEFISENVGKDIQESIKKLIKEILIQAKNPLTQIPPNQLFDLLLHIDFKEQRKLFKDVLQLHRTAAFLVHGEPNCGQELLVSWLFRLTPNWRVISPIKNIAAYQSAERLWLRLAQYFDLRENPKPNEEILERICERLQNQDVVFIFNEVNNMLPEELSKWLEEFWKPLVKRAKENIPKRKTYLLMFLVDKSGRVCQSNVALTTQFNKLEHRHLPLNLPPVTRFSPDELDDWIDIVKTRSDVQIPAGLTSQKLLEKSENGIPQFIYEEICYHCGHSWEGVVQCLI